MCANDQYCHLEPQEDLRGPRERGKGDVGVGLRRTCP
jgi:hypothetical protein